MSAKPNGAEVAPGYFYKYRSLSEEHRERTLLSIVHGVIWFSSPKNFNDKMDCQIPVSYETPPERFRAFAERALSAVKPHLTPEERKTLIDEGIRSGDYADPERIDCFRKSQKKQIMERGVLSLCSTNVSDRMWCEYADEHRGCCLQFKRSDRGMFANVRRARYEKELPTANPYKAPYVEVNDTIMLTKGDAFGFEHEWRIWDPRGPGYWKYNPGDLTGVIFGHLMSEEDRGLLAYLVRRSHPPARIYQMVKNETGLELIVWAN